VQYYCPNCFAERTLEAHEQPCPICGTDPARWEAEHSFAERLRHALKHPNPQARMMAILTLGNRGEPEAAIPLAECAFDHPLDVVQDLEIVRAIQKIRSGPERTRALEMLTQHAIRAVRAAAADLLASDARV
jgi:HEAT repeat protein